MDSLPIELIEHILCLNQLSYFDVSNFSQTSYRHWNCVKNNREIWRLKFERQWPRLYKDIHGDSIDWQKEVIQRHRYGKEMDKQIRGLSKLHYHDNEMSEDDFKPFDHYHRHENVHDHGQLFQIDHLESIVNDEEKHSNLTVKFYAEKVLRFLRHEWIKTKWENMDDLFEGSLLISSWCQPNCSIDRRHYLRQIELMAQLTIDLIDERFSSNPMKRCLTNDQSQSLKQSMFSPEHCRNILLCLNEVLFTQLRFSGNKNNYYCASNSFVDRVIETRLGIPITLCIIYSSIAAKLGVKTFPVNFPGHFLLKWNQHPDLSSDHERFTYIDVFDNGRFLSHDQCLSLIPDVQNEEIFSVCDSLTVFRRMCRNLVEVGRQQEVSSEQLLCLRNALELLHFLAPQEIESRLLLSRVYIHLNINLEEVNRMLQQIIDQDPASTGTVMYLQQSVNSQLSAKRRKHPIKRRDPKVVFGVGMIMRHKKYNYSCVIFGWDPTCAASKDWIYQMGVHNLTHKDKQPFYNVLVEDGSTRYAAQENLEISKDPKEITHPEIGKYFKEFAVDHYVANDEKNEEYPDDETIVGK